MEQININKVPTIQELQVGNAKALARIISLVENQSPGYEILLAQLPASKTQITGITGPPGAGKSTLVDALIEEGVRQHKKIGVLCVDPSSPFHAGALLGDRIRMNRWHNQPGVFIRSLAARGKLGGLSAATIEIMDVMKAAGFDQLLIETVGVGQSEVEIAALADTTVVVLVPEAGDEIQSMKAGLMEIANIFVVNKADRPGADAFVKQLRAMRLPEFSSAAIPIIKTIATTATGIAELATLIAQQEQTVAGERKKLRLLAHRAYQLIVKKRMQDIDADFLMSRISTQWQQEDFNVYRFVNQLLNK